MGIIIALLIALLISILFMFSRTKYSPVSMITLFIILFLVGIASQYWLVPYGPLLWGVAWIPMVFLIIMVALLFASPPLGHRPLRAEEKAIRSASQFWVTFSLVTWIVLTILLLAVVIGYFLRKPGPEY